jgi:hypothetical protein
MRRGDLVTIALQGDYGKPRPALIVQSDGNPPDKPKTPEVEFSKKEVLREEIEIYRQPNHGCLEAC